MIHKLGTERRNERTMDLDEMSILGILETMNSEDKEVPEKIKDVLPAIEALVKETIAALKKNGRILYVGAGTSGRLGVLDAVECPPTFGTAPETVQGFIAGGDQAFTKAKEGAEDSQEAGREDLEKVQLSENDVVIGLAASGRTPYVIGALAYAREIGAVTGSIACNLDAAISKWADHPIEINTGPEVLTGSTRLKAGTAQKLVLNMISSASMIGYGKVYQNLMVDVKATNEKLVARSHRIIQEATGVDEATAVSTFEAANHHVKTAIVMILADVSAEEAVKRLDQAEGFVRQSI
ncbi:N-acetylmuramic acid 6-phosphate etherase [Salsuginibacillus kocurii]|uniref:N-acetylmuramic acid 6-phosphate etherase n=1 Tax=Salsuginibacillus kocurii TaxID=427078 RepID=UPI00037A32A1|nr:N-acetylmuramic acid 6-phosphate etherase [Salsuginibacillus kocurii]